jgi:hypothetical protein
MINQAIEQLTLFRRTIAVPALESIQQTLQQMGYQVSMPETPPQENDLIREMRQAVERRSTTSHDRQGEHWILATLVALVSDQTVAEQQSYEDAFCYGVECTLAENKVYGVLSIVYKRQDQIGFQRFEHSFLEDEWEKITTIGSAELVIQLLELLITAQMQGVQLEPGVSEPASKAIATREQTLRVGKISEMKEIPPVDEVSPVKTISPVETVFSVAAPPTISGSPLEIQCAQQQEVQAFLTSLGMKQQRVDILWGFSLSRTLEWIRHISDRLETLSGESLQVYEWLIGQGNGFAQSLNPQAADEAVDYLRFYEMVLRQDCHRAIEKNPAQTQAQAWKDLVQSSGQPDNPAQITAEAMRQMRLWFKRLARQFGQVDTFGVQEYIGFCDIYVHGHTTAQQITQIQNCSKQQQLKFEQLSWGVLQLYENAGYAPQQELDTRRTLLHGYLYSLRLTVEQPTQTVERVVDTAKDYRFYFRRRLADGRLAEATVRATGQHGQTTLVTYHFLDGPQIL